MYISAGKAVSKVYIYEIVNTGRKKQQMNIKNESENNYLDANLRRGSYKIFLQCGKKHVGQYFEEGTSSSFGFKKKKQKLI